MIITELFSKNTQWYKCDSCNTTIFDVPLDLKLVQTSIIPDAAEDTLCHTQSYLYELNIFRLTHQMSTYYFEKTWHR